MLCFTSDYTTGAHPEILRRLIETNMEALPGYGTDKYSVRAAEKIKAACAAENAQVFFVAGGTQTNQLVISTMLGNYEGVIAAKTGHISVHEAGAVEYTGHKVIELNGKEGKLDAESLKRYLKSFFADENHEHMVFPGMVYVSFPTEYGTLYSKKELRALYGVCREYDIPIFIDGARLGYGLCSRACDITLPELAELCDVFYVGGTKVGAICGEAVVFTHANAPRHFVTQIKQHGAMLAKGRLIGIQFDTLFTDNLYFTVSQHAIRMAEQLKMVFQSAGYRFFLDSPTNQQFIILKNDEMKRLAQEVEFSYWEPYDESHTVVRFATSWSTAAEDIEKLEEILNRMH